MAEGRPLPIIARLYALYYKMDSLMDSYTTLVAPDLALHRGRLAQAHRVDDVRPARRARAQFTVQTDAPIVNSRFRPNVQDGLATLYALRSRNLKPATALSIPVADEGTALHGELRGRRARAGEGAARDDRRLEACKITVLD